MNLQTSWQLWALGSAIFAAATAITAKIGVSGVDSNLGDGDSHRRYRIVRVGDRLAHRRAEQRGASERAHLVFPDFVGAGDGRFVAVLFPRVATRPRRARGARRQIKRGLRDRFGRAVSGRGADLARRFGRRAHRVGARGFWRREISPLRFCSRAGYHRARCR